MNNRLAVSLAVVLMMSAFGANAATSPAAATTPAAKAAPVRCHDAKGKFVKCDTAKKPAATRCHDAKGKFIACPK